MAQITKSISETIHLRFSKKIHFLTDFLNLFFRWLRQAISEDHTDADVAYVNGGSYSEEINMPSPSSEAAMDTVTPLKKRRLANYKEDTENEEKFLENLGVGDSPIKDAQGHVKHVPNGLKKQILQNLVLEAVLDKAMEDMLATPATVSTLWFY